jgi:hypothetical protein
MHARRRAQVPWRVRDGCVCLRVRHYVSSIFSITIRYFQECDAGNNNVPVSGSKRVLRVIKILRFLKIMRLLKGIKIVE